MAAPTNRRYYGPENKDIIERHRVVRDVRSVFQKIGDLLKQKEVGIPYVVFGLITFVFPTFALPILIIGGPFLFIANKYKPHLPLYVPKTSTWDCDPHDIHPATKKPNKPNATFYLGIDANTGEEVWLTDAVARQHFFYAGSTGSGKTESLTGMVVNAFIYSSGFLFIDGKADLKLPAKIMAIAHRFMRIDDVLMINYITGGKTFWDASLSMTSNSFNPFVSGSVSSISELLKSLLDGEGDIWSKRADDFISGLTRPLVYKRDIGEINLSVKDYVHYLGLKELGRLCGDSNLSMDIKGEIYNFVRTLPGMDGQSFELIKKGQDLSGNATVYDQFGYITMQIIPVLNMLKGDYGFIFNVVQGHINMHDVVASRRVLLVLIPALEKSSSALSALGRIVVTATKDMMASGLGSEYEGDLKRNLERRFTSSDTCFNCICDEAGYYFVEGAFAAMFAQARSLGVSMCLALQDIPALERAGDKARSESRSVISNSNTKIGGRIEDKETLDIFLDRGGKAKVASADRLDIDYKPTISRNVENSIQMSEVSRLELSDFTSMIEGETIIIHKEYNPIRVDMFAVFPPDLRKATLNEFTPVPKLTSHELERYKTLPIRLSRLMSNAINKKRDIVISPLCEELKIIGEKFDKQVTHESIPTLSAKSIWKIAFDLTEDYKNQCLDDYDEMFASVSNDPVSYNYGEEVHNDSDSTGSNAGQEDSTHAVENNVSGLEDVNAVAASSEERFNNAWDNALSESGMLSDEYFDEITEINITHADQKISREEAEKISKQTINDLKANMLYPGKPKLEQNKQATLDILMDINAFLE